MDNTILKDIYKKRSKVAINSLKANHFDALYTDTIQEAAQKALSLIPDSRTVGIGGSVTIREIGLVDALKKQGNIIFSHWEEGLTPEEKADKRKKALTSDIYLTSSNAITLNGQLVNIDGTGNRVGAMVFGPKKIIIIAGANKLVNNLDEAFARIRNIAAPLNGSRLNLKTPCALTGKCVDCDSPDRMCNVSVVIHKKPNLSDITVILVGETLGY